MIINPICLGNQSQKNFFKKLKYYKDIELLYDI